MFFCMLLSKEVDQQARPAGELHRYVLPSFSAIFNRKMQKSPPFSCILLRNEGKPPSGMAFFWEQHAMACADENCNSAHDHGSSENMRALFLHVLADTLGSVGVVLSR